MLQDRVGEYLFFIGTVYLSLLLLKKRCWIGAGGAFLLGVVWLAFHLPVSLYLESLGVDSFAETKNFNLGEARFWLQTLRDPLHDSRRSVISRTRAVCRIVFLANSKLLASKRRLASHPDPTATSSPELCRGSLGKSSIPISA